MASHVGDALSTKGEGAVAAMQHSMKPNQPTAPMSEAERQAYESGAVGLSSEEREAISNIEMLLGTWRGCAHKKGAVSDENPFLMD